MHRATVTGPKAPSVWRALFLPGARPFIGLFLIDGIADIAWWVALGAFVSKDGAWGTAALAVASTLAAVLMLPAGALIGKWRPGRVLLVTTILKIIVLGSFGLATLSASTAPVAAVAGAAILLGIVDGFHLPSLDVVLTGLLPREAQEAGVGIERLTGRAAQMLGGFLAGALIASSIPTSVCLVSAGLWLVGLPLIGRFHQADEHQDSAAAVDDAISAGPADAGRLKPQPGRITRVQLWFEGTFDGVRFIARSPILSRSLPAQSTFNLATAGLSLIGFPLLAVSRSWGQGATGRMFGIWGLGLGIGTIIAMVARSWPTQRRRPGCAMILIALAGILAMLLATDMSYRMHLILIALMGIVSGPVGVWLTGLTRRQAKDQATTAAITSVSTLALTGIEFVGLFLVTLLAAVLGTMAVFIVVGGCISLLGAVGAGSKALWDAD